MAEATTINVGAVVNNMSNADTVQKQAEILARAIQSAGISGASELIGSLHDKALDDLGFARGFLLTLDTPLMSKALSAGDWDKIRFNLRKSDRLRPLDELLDGAKNLDATSMMMFKAKTAMVIQLVYLLRERINEEGLPDLKMSATDLARLVLNQGTLRDKVLTIDLNDFGRGYWNLFVETLKEADFRTDDKVVYTSVLSDSAAKRSADGLDLVSSGRAGEGGKLSETVLARMGANVIKRLSLLLRTVKMYSSADHPSISLALESLQNTIDNMLKDREQISLSRVGGDLLVENVRLKKSAAFLEDFSVALEERNINSLTLRKGITLDEVRAFVLIFAETAAQIRGRGGVKGILTQKRRLAYHHRPIQVRHHRGRRRRRKADRRSHVRRKGARKPRLHRNRFQDQSRRRHRRRPRRGCRQGVSELDFRSVPQRLQIARDPGADDPHAGPQPRRSGAFLQRRFARRDELVDREDDHRATPRGFPQKAQRRGTHLRPRQPG
ncbi:MAG: hypothetical protein M5R36_27415 [Deltaproteobacteria bacterium]|nr:hypothetical protein [Deltaproteobacteria bacterium]